MAGESPDRSKQQQSSGETTPGERDPRVAVFGAGDGPARPSGSPVDAAESVNGSANRSTNGSSNGSSKGGSSNGTVSGKAGTNGSANSSANVSANGSVSGSVNGSANGSAPDLAEDGGSASASASASVDQATAVFRAPRQEDAESRDTRLRAAVAAWVVTDGDPEDGDTPRAEDGAKAASGPAEPDDVRESVPAPAAAPGDEPKPKQETDAKPKPDADAEPVASAKPDAESEPDADAEPVTGPEPVASAKPDSDSEPDAEPKAEAEPAVEPKADAKPKADEAKAEPDARPKAEKPAAAAKTAPAAPKADDDASDATAEDGDADTDADKPAARAASWGAKLSQGSEVDGADADKSDDKNDDKDDDKGGDAVDQPTTVFKAVRPPVVDQPTTAIRLPSKGKGAGKPESDSEQTSTFVPLRSDDVRPAAKATEARAGGEAKATNAAAPYVKTPTSPRIQVPDAAPALPEGAERTRQQPLPPKPPLDLLAELTNTPPPAQTPVRTVVRRFKIWTPLVILLLVVFAVVQYVRPLPDPALKMTSAAEYTFDGAAPQLPWPTEGQGLITVSGLGTVGRFGEEKPVPIASVTKSMTAYIIMRDHPMKPGSKGASIPVDKLAEKEGGYNKTGDESTVDTIKAGQNLSQKDALSAVMIPSANNVARLLARWDAGGSEAAFVKKMNDTAKELGMTNTTYTDPSGLNATTVSTAVDQVKLATELVKMPALVDITKQPSWTDPSGKSWRNYNTLVPYNGAIGIKTGSTTKAGGNLLFASVKDVGGTKQTIVGAVFGQHKGISILDTVNKVSKDVLIDTRKSLTSATVIKKDTVVGYVDDGLGGKTPVVATKDLTVAGWPGLRTTIALTATGAKVPHSAKAGTVVGQLTVGSGAGQVSAPVALQKALAEPGFGSKLTRLG